MTAFYGNYAFDPVIPGRDSDILETDKAAYWENIAEQAVMFFTYKDDFMEWVCSHYFLDENRFTADMSWDMAKMVVDNPEMDCV